jgi:hypothetical protein
MKRHLHWWAAGLFVLALSFELIVWGAAAGLPDVGAKLLVSAQREAPLVDFYMRAGAALDGAIPALGRWGADYATTALREGFERIEGDPTVAMDLVLSQTWNAHHAILKHLHWGAPVLGVLALVLWMRRPKKVHLMGSRRR